MFNELQILLPEKGVGWFVYGLYLYNGALYTDTVKSE